jgi:hypothetical protein
MPTKEVKIGSCENIRSDNNAEDGEDKKGGDVIIVMDPVFGEVCVCPNKRSGRCVDESKVIRLAVMKVISVASNPDHHKKPVLAVVRKKHDHGMPNNRWGRRR